MPTADAARLPRPLQQAGRLYPGAVVSILLALAAYALSEQYGAPIMLLALLLGMAISFLGEDARCGPGIDFCATSVLRLGVALLGLRITASHLLDLGWLPAMLVVVAVVLTTAFGTLLVRPLRLSTELGVLTGGAVAICGASAAIAISAVLPKRENADKELVFAIVGVTALSTLAMIIYPAIAGSLGLGDEEAGVFLGGTIHDVAQVVGAGYSISGKAGDLATIVKLLRVAMLVPMVFALMFLFQRAAAGVSGRAATFPAFLLAFVGFVIINSFGLIPALIVDAGVALSRWCLVTAIAAVGMKTALREVSKVGFAPVVLMVLETAFIAGVVLTGYMLIPELI
ncbi:MAG: putative sulfate exporter family transporter [Gammaproteobacteria bacterium]|nr:putative sulfate exporter family transporter [Gammaproteobacteria bacterium]